MSTVTEFVAGATGWNVQLIRRAGSSSVVVQVERTFGAADVAAYRAFERDAEALLDLAPITTPGSTWGTDSASVGGHASLTGGYMRLSKSGVSVRWAQI